MGRYECLRHMTSGEIFAVELDDKGRVIASIGPLARRELTHDPGDFARNMTAEDNDWFAEEDAQAGEWGAFSLLEGMQLAMVIGEARETEEAP